MLAKLKTSILDVYLDVYLMQVAHFNLLRFADFRTLELINQINSYNLLC
jgi:hypothetical protein